jgi:hypothetical protein
MRKYLSIYLSVLTVLGTLGLGVIGSAIAAHPAFAGPDDDAAFSTDANCGGPSKRSCN